MEYISTRSNYKKVKAAEVVVLGMVPEGGLFVPAKIPELSLDEIVSFKDKSYQKIAEWIFSKYLSDFSKAEIKKIVEKAYKFKNFPLAEKTPLVKLKKNTYILELWHGPTAAFKDLALQLLPHLLKKASQKLEINKEIVILTATSGDTGKAALEGFKDIEGVKIIVFYPEKGVSRVQRDQMESTAASNTEVAAVQGNFDDCQNAVKTIFSDQKFKEKLAKNNYQLSSANSINWGRLLPQIIYYFKAYFELLNKNKIKKGEKINIAVPTGNFGNILAAYYAYRMGLPINKFICASNDNKVLTDFIDTGIYNIERKFIKTISPSMDILISSNLERFLFEITNHNAKKINKWYNSLRENNRFEIDELTKNKIKKLFSGQFSSESEVRKSIKFNYDNYNYLLDPHTAVAVDSLNKYRRKNDDYTLTLIDSTANPYKFSRAVLESLKEKRIKKNEYRIIEELESLTSTKVHRGLQNLENQEAKNNHLINKNKVKDKLAEILDI